MGRRVVAARYTDTNPVGTPRRARRRPVRPALEYCWCRAVKHDGQCPRHDQGRTQGYAVWCRDCLEVHTVGDACRPWTPASRAA
jgi:hypothetical protein